MDNESSVEQWSVYFAYVRMTSSFNTSFEKVFCVFSAHASHALLGKDKRIERKMLSESALEEAKSANGSRENAKY